jgi:hypothetical protein
MSADEISQIVGIRVSAVDIAAQGGNPDSGCRFAVPAGATDYREPDVSASRATEPLTEVRAYYENPPPADATDQARIINRPDLGTEAFVLKSPGKRGATASFPAAGGTPFVVTIALGFAPHGGYGSAADQSKNDQIIALIKARVG